MKAKIQGKENPLVRSILDTIQDPFFILDRQGAILLFNVKGMEALGYSADEFGKMNFFQMFSPTEQPRLKKEFEEMEQDRELRLKSQMASRSGETIPVDVVGVIRGGRSFVTLRDLRDRVRVEKEWELTKKEFTEKVRERDQYSRELQVMKDHYKEKLKELREMKEEVERLSYTDELTGICNRRFFIQLLTLEVERQKRYPYPVSLLMIDIDYFKHYNDTNGHLDGDQILKAIAILIERGVRQTDIVARFGGEEFAAILINASQKDAMDIAERVRRNVAETPFPNGRAQPNGRLTVSIGVATFAPSFTTPDDFIREADNALYRAKRAGRDRVEA
jgi:diguanylate cyclase (GGDEF)-like protein/PAS domain S-box-containing protein